MANSNRILNSLKAGTFAGFPVMFGYFPVAMAFGILSKDVGISFIDSALFSVVVFAGASQFMALDLIKAGISTGNIILATFLLNLRHLMMSASLSQRLKDIKKHWIIFIAFGVTDETFSVSSLSKRKLDVPFLLALHTVAYCSWIAGTIVGYLLGRILPLAVQSSLSIGLYAMFTALLIPEVKKSTSVLLMAIFSGIVYAVIYYLRLLPSSWNLIVTIIISSSLGVLFLKDDTEEEIAV